MKAFKAYDIRGVYNRDFNRDDVYKIGFFLPRLLACDKVLVGRDVRESTEEIFEALCRGINDAGADVHDMGLATTPMVYFGTAHFGYDASVQITASHNPKEYNGLKVSKTGALPVGYYSGLSELEKMVEHEEVHTVNENRGKVQRVDVRAAYLDFMRRYVPEELDQLDLTVDCSNGMAALLIKELLGDRPHYLYDTLDGTFPNHAPNPLEPENVRDLQAEVRKRSSDLGVIFDGDADRVMFVDEKANFIPPDLIIGVIGRYYLSREKGNVLQDIRTSLSVSEYIEKLGGTPHTWKVGHAFAKLKMRELNAVFGGELAGHYYFRDFHNCDSGILAALLVLRVLIEWKKQGGSMSGLIEEIKTYANSGEINFHIEKKSKAMEALKDYFSTKEAPVKLLDFDGYRLEYPRWWFNVRPSNTEPYLRLVVEAKTEEELQERLAEIRKILTDFE
ncbi:MAG TPA: phosphomannomutase/phosphoglucomutase [Sediminispirochaeta sp.]|nr:phosphomannomutase/phosphoglucomutase [Sediminispirochaeta sp.]